MVLGQITLEKDHNMTRLRTFTFATLAAVGLSACMSEGSMDPDSNQGVFLITHTGPGTVYWQ